MSATAPTDTGKCAYALGEDGLASWDQVHADAWIGLLETHKRLTRALEAELEAEHGLTISALELLARLAAAENQSLGLSALAGLCGLSLSRVSRIMDALEARGLVERRPVRGDARAVEGHLTDTGLDLVRRAQASHFAAVQRRFFEPLSQEQVSALADIFSRFVPRAEACPAASREDPPAGR
ncbi:MAG TPA: MarR family winged helix-turn-helix transcriptional regulator [Solirubrobacteraceae bacterium]|nr:MarR family winged helix-turn-helix transcriptional regulator [Solirubrobacteraceae bacterium]